MLVTTLLAIALSGTPPAVAAPKSGEACKRALDRGIADLERLPSQKRIGASLELLATSCPKELEGLAKAASKARGLRRALRAEVLAQAAQMDPPCKADVPGASATELARACPPATLEFSSAAVGNMDSGTYLFVAAVARRLEAAGALAASAERVLSVLVLAAALEGEAAR